MSPNFPTPDRSNFTPNFTKTVENDVLDIGWAEGLLSDGRPYWLECWCQDQVTCVTIFISRIGLEDLDDQGIQALLEKEDLAHFPYPERHAGAERFTDPSGNDLWSINIVVADDSESFANGGPAIQPYRKSGA